MDTVADRDDVTVLLLNGKIISGKKGVEELHKAWFGDPDWRFETETTRVIQTPTTAIALLRVTYHDLAPTGEDGAKEPVQFSYFLSLHFSLIDGSWQMIFDQNSALPKPTR